MIHFCLKDPIFIFSFWCQLLICVNTGSVVHESITYDFTSHRLHFDVKFSAFKSHFLWSWVCVRCELWPWELTHLQAQLKVEVSRTRTIKNSGTHITTKSTLHILFLSDNKGKAVYLKLSKNCVFKGQRWKLSFILKHVKDNTTFENVPVTWEHESG